MVIVIRSVRSFDLNWSEFIFFCLLQWENSDCCSTVMVNIVKRILLGYLVLGTL